jgi:hypothetical protein
MAHGALAGLLLAASVASHALADTMLGEQRLTGTIVWGSFSSTNGAIQTLGHLTITTVNGSSTKEIYHVSWRTVDTVAPRVIASAQGCVPLSAVVVRGDQVSFAFDSASLSGDCMPNGQPDINGTPGRWVGKFTFARGIEYGFVTDSVGDSVQTARYSCGCPNEAVGTCTDRLQVSGSKSEGTASFEGTVADQTIVAPVHDHNGDLTIIRGLRWDRTSCEIR